MSDLVECALRELTRRKGRTLANIFGYALAVAVMVVLVNVLIVSRAASDGVLTSTGTHFIAFVPACSPACLEDSSRDNEGFVASGVSASLFSKGHVDRVRNLATVKDASPYLLYRFKNPQDGHVFTLGGFEQGNNVAVRTTCCAETDIVSGRFIRPDDKDAVMLEEAYATARELKTGDTVTVAGETLRVIGIINPGIRPAKADMYMPVRDAERLVSERIGLPIGDQANVVLVEVASAPVQDEAIESVKRTIPGAVISSYACYKPASLVLGMNERSMWLLAVVVGISAILLSLKSQLSAVVERRHDIGILKAIGWTDRSVVSQILTESVLQALAGGVVGCLVGAVVLLVTPLQTLFGVGTTLSVGTLLVVFGVGLALAALGGAIAGSFPARAAARLRPAEALRRV